MSIHIHFLFLIQYPQDVQCHKCYQGELVGYVLMVDYDVGEKRVVVVGVAQMVDA